MRSWIVSAIYSPLKIVRPPRFHKLDQSGQQRTHDRRAAGQLYPVERLAYAVFEQALADLKRTPVRACKRGDSYQELLKDDWTKAMLFLTAMEGDWRRAREAWAGLLSWTDEELEEVEEEAKAIMGCYHPSFGLASNKAVSPDVVVSSEETASPGDSSICLTGLEACVTVT